MVGDSILSFYIVFVFPSPGKILKPVSSFWPIHVKMYLLICFTWWQYHYYYLNGERNFYLLFLLILHPLCFFFFFRVFLSCMIALKKQVCVYSCSSSAGFWRPNVLSLLLQWAKLKNSSPYLGEVINNLHYRSHFTESLRGYQPVKVFQHPCMFLLIYHCQGLGTRGQRPILK